MACAPPPPPPPTQQILSFVTKSDVQDGRGLLLESIRKGKHLKKAVTNDKSGPLIAGNVAVKASTNVNTSAANTRTATNNRQLNESQPVALGGLFANGIPKLKATGLPIGQAYQQYRNETDSVQSNSNSNKNINGASNNIHNNSHSTKSRGPPPQPPGAPPKITSSLDRDADEFSAHSRTASAVSLNDSYQNRVSDATHINHGKPTVAPKPHSIGNKLDRPLVSRAQSMRVPRSSPNVTKTENGQQNPEFNQSELYRINNKNHLPSFHQSQESLSRRNNRSSSPSRMGSSNSSSWASLNNTTATLRPYNRSHGSPLRPPLSKPPPPPPTRVAMSPPMCPPPPPPTHAPPPPPHRVNPAPPPPPSVIQNRLNNNFSNAPPTPPVRNSSMRSSTSSNIKTSSFETRFLSMFHTVEEFPHPPPYENVLKIYNSRIQAKQQAPQPPLQLQQSINRMWQCENTSNC